MALLGTLFQIALGGGLGAACRFLMSSGVMRLTGGGFPAGIMAVNILGSFAMGIAVVFFAQKLGDLRWAPLVLTGFLGGFTTFSAFSLDTIQLVEKGRIGAAAIYVGGSVGLSIAALFLGLALARGFWS